MKTKLLFHIAAALPLNTAHSWLSCTDHDNTEILEWMKTNASATGSLDLPDPLMPWHAHLCHAFPRAKQNPGDWMQESSDYLWAPNTATEEGKFACHKNQRTPTYLSAGESGSENAAPMAKAKAGGTLNLLWGGNGHARGANAGGDEGPGTVSIFWAGEKEKEIVLLSELTDEKLVQKGGFAEEAFLWPEDESVKKPGKELGEGLWDKGCWMTLRL